MPPSRGRPGKNVFGYFRLDGSSGDHLITKERCVLGRHSDSVKDADINVSKHSACSRTHAVIEWQPSLQAWTICPLKKNSIYINGSRMEKDAETGKWQKHTLQSGDAVSIIDPGPTANAGYKDVHFFRGPFKPPGFAAVDEQPQPKRAKTLDVGQVGSATGQATGQELV